MNCSHDNYILSKHLTPVPTTHVLPNNIPLCHSKQHVITTHILLTEGIGVFFVGVRFHAATNYLEDVIENVEGWNHKWSVMVLLNGAVTLETPDLV